MNRAAVGAVAILGLGAFAFSGPLYARGTAPESSEPGESWFPFSPYLTYDPAINYDASIDSAPELLETLFPDQIMQLPQNSAPVASANNAAANLVAFLQLIRQGESSDNYTALVGGGNFGSFDDHPAILGPWKGIRRADGRLTTAAGGYQITRTTWKDLGGVKKYGSFSPSAQDAAAIDLLKRRGAYDFVLRGEVSAAVAKLPDEWEMFTLRRWSVANSSKAFSDFGGILA
jgi:muramidase (phage lysozyme)